MVATPQLVQNKYLFDYNFQRKIVSLLFQDWEFLINARSLIKPGYFTNESLAHIVNCCFQVFDTYKMPLTEDSVRAVIAQTLDETDAQLANQQFVDFPLQVPDLERKLMLDMVAEFACHAEVKRLILESGPKIHEAQNADDHKKIMNKLVDDMRFATQIGESIGDAGTYYFQDVDKRLEFSQEAYDNAVRTLITDLDKRMMGHGLIEADLGVFLAPYGVGKTFALNHMAAAGLLQRKQVLYLTLEMPAELLGLRFDAAFSGVPTLDLRNHMAAVREAVDDMGVMIGPENFIIKHFSIGESVYVDDIRAYMTRLQGMNFRPDLVVIDYADLIHAKNRSRLSSYDEGKEVYNSLKGLAKDFQTRVWTASQVNRDGSSKKLIGGDDTADSYAKGFIADFVISLNQTAEEEQTGKMRLYLAKNRNARKGMQIPILTDYAHGKFYKIPT